MLPAGEMWSVVTESPSTASTRAPQMSVTGAGVLRACRRSTAPCECKSSPAPTGRRRRWGSSAPASSHRHLLTSRTPCGSSRCDRPFSMAAATSACVGQMSRRYTGLPVLVLAQRIGVEVVPDASRPARTPPPAAGSSGNSRARPRSRAPQNCDCRSARSPQPARARRSTSTHPRAAVRSCRCTSCSRSPPR